MSRRHRRRGNLGRESRRRESPPRIEPAFAPRPVVQAVFCIDVRSEVFRRALESVVPGAQTLGFAGFFGFPIEYVPLGSQSGSKQCPVLLTPKFRIREVVRGETPARQAAIVRRRDFYEQALAAWTSFKTSAGTCFSYVETSGLLFGPKLIGDSFGWTRPVARPVSAGLARDVVARLGPSIAPAAESAAEADPIRTHTATEQLDSEAYCYRHAPAARSSGVAAADRVATAEAVLRAMSLTRSFARLVLLTGHRSTSVNNPHAAGLDCGACGGASGESNARVAAAVFNDPQVRAALSERGLVIPADTWFVAALHDTTTDQVTLFGQQDLPASHRLELAQVQSWLQQAGALTRQQRALRLGTGALTPLAIDADIAQRSRDWSQVRPEWGLAGNSSFIVAPRSRTVGLDLGGRAFLHSYDWQADADLAVLELIMTAPMIVASWINLQYYGSTVNNAAFGSGNKVLHNVVGTVGVLQGNGGDLQVGLPLQSVHDGERFLHEPLRLNVIIEAPQAAVNAVIAKHAKVRELLDHGWLHLFLLADRGSMARRYVGDLQWQELDRKWLTSNPGSLHAQRDS